MKLRTNPDSSTGWFDWNAHITSLEYAHSRSSTSSAGSGGVNFFGSQVTLLTRAALTDDSDSLGFSYKLQPHTAPSSGTCAFWTQEQNLTFVPITFYLVKPSSSLICQKCLELLLGFPKYMLYSHKFPPINLHIFESLFCVSSVLGIEDLEMFKTLSLPAESSQTCKRQV